VRKGQQHRQASHLVRAMQRHAIVPEVYSCSAAIGVCDKRQQHRQALHLLRVIPRHALEPDVVTYSAASSVCRSAGVLAARGQTEAGSGIPGYSSASRNSVASSVPLGIPRGRPLWPLRPGRPLRPWRPCYFEAAEAVGAIEAVEAVWAVGVPPRPVVFRKAVGPTALVDGEVPLCPFPKPSSAQLLRFFQDLPPVGRRSPRRWLEERVDGGGRRAVGAAGRLAWPALALSLRLRHALPR